MFKVGDMFPQKYILNIKSETTVYSDRLSLHYPPISDVFDRVFFVHYTNDSTLTLLRNSLFNNNKQNIFFHCYKKHLKWGDDPKKKVSPIIQCSMIKSISESINSNYKERSFTYCYRFLKVVIVHSLYYQRSVTP